MATSRVVIERWQVAMWYGHIAKQNLIAIAPNGV